MRLPNFVYEKVKARRVEVFYADRWMTNFWNNNRSRGDLRMYCGWYWWIRDSNNRAATSENGPFNTQAAAYRDAFEKCQLRSFQ